MFGQKGHAYVYFIYGMYFCINVTAGDVAGKPEAVLIRALEPLIGMEIMAKRRGPPGAKLAYLTNGPGKLCIAMGITKTLNKTDITAPPLYIENALTIPQEDIVETARIGVDYAGDWKNRCLRFYIKENSHVSVKKTLKRTF
jgi:DNA-3-methyladenine glycosylase